MNIPRPLKIESGKVYALDQRALPDQELYLEMNSLEDCHEFIRDMVVRGAPLIGFTALWGMVVWLRRSLSTSLEDYKKAAEFLKTARPTAVNLAYELDESVQFLSLAYEKGKSNEVLLSLLEDFATGQMEKLERDNRKMAELAYQELVTQTGKSSGFRLLTLCNTGFLACGTTGTALGVISTLQEKNQLERVFACETRPYLQGARLTAYELDKMNVDHLLIVEGAISYVLERESIDAIFVGADRIALNGDTANKIGTSTLAIVARHYNIPFYVVAPVSSFDLNMSSGDQIEIEMRPDSEITHWKGKLMTSAGTHGLNPSFDVTRGTLIEGIICENGLIRPSNGVEELRKIAMKAIE
jgi:methylthioribose-1-phosphate isomerase